MSNGYGLNFKKVTQQVAKLYRKACGATKKNQELIIPAFSYPYPTGIGASICVAVYTIPITTPWSIRYPFNQPSTSFVAVARYVSSGVTYRYKLWNNVGEILPLPLYIGETLPAGTAIEIWTGSTNPAELTQTWRLPLGILENPSAPCDHDGTDINPTVCVPPSSGPITTMLATCAA